jgi:hypothetical protein
MFSIGATKTEHKKEGCTDERKSGFIVFFKLTHFNCSTIQKYMHL